MMEDRETREAWATVKVRSVADRVGDGTGEGQADAEEAMKKDGKYLKMLVRNLAEKGAVSGLALTREMHISRSSQIPPPLFMVHAVDLAYCACNRLSPFF